MDNELGIANKDAHRLNGTRKVFQNVKFPLAALLQPQGCQHILQAGY